MYIYYLCTIREQIPELILTNESLVKDYIKQIWCMIVDDRILFLVALIIQGEKKQGKI